MNGGSAKLLIDQHGDEAPIHAAMKAVDMLERGNMDGRAVLLRIVDAIRDMLRETPFRAPVESLR